MLFPRTIFADKNTIWRQYFHLVSEVWELGVAILRAKIDDLTSGESCDRFWNHVADEAVDIQISADTLLHIAMDKHGADAYGAYGRVTRGNAKRGYYGGPKTKSYLRQTLNNIEEIATYHGGER